MEVVYRSLSDFDLHQLEKVGALTSKQRLASTEKLKCALQLINTHIKNGTTLDTCWISSTSCLRTAVGIYNLPSVEQRKKRNPVAVIKNHSKNELLDCNQKDLFEYDWDWIQKRYPKIVDFPLDQINKVNYCFWDRSSVKRIGNSGLILKKDGTPCGNNVTIYGYALASSEVLTLHEIPKEDIKGLLSPEQMDFLYSLGPNHPNFDSSLASFLEGASLKQPTSLILRALWNELYQEQKSLSDLTYELWLQDQGDLLDIYCTLLQLRKELFISRCDTVPSYFGIPEEKRKIIRLGEKKDEKAQILYHGYQLDTVFPTWFEKRDFERESFGHVGLIGCTDPNWSEEQIWSCRGAYYTKDQLFKNQWEEVKQYIKYK